MTDDLINRLDAVAATRVGPSDEWSRSTKDGYELAATDCMMNILKIQPVLSDADLSPALGAVAMREAALDAVAKAAWKHDGDDAYSAGMEDGARHQSQADYDAISALPLPSDAALDRAALARPNVAALRTAARNAYYKGEGAMDALCAALTALEAKP